jgi:ubiquinone/menaquinone biosynthesis C-methylase UbiE
MRTFGRPRGLLGKLGGIIMARTNADFGIMVADLLEIEPTDHVLKVGFGPGAVIQRLAQQLPSASIAGIDPSPEMVAQARARNLPFIQGGRVDLRQGLVESLPFGDNRFDKAWAVNSMQIWPDAIVGLKEMLRVMKPGGGIALGFTPHSRQPNSGLLETINAAGFANPHIVNSKMGFCALATKPL